MIFLYSPSAGQKNIILEKDDENFVYLTKVKRHAVGEKILLRNLEDNTLYTYVFAEITKKTITFTLESSQKDEEPLNSTRETKKNVHLAWGICDPKTIQKTLPFLNEIGVGEITFLDCERSQKIFVEKFSNPKNQEKYFQKLQKILENSCQQCGRSTRMKLTFESLKNFLEGKNLEELIICDFPAQKTFAQISPENFPNPLIVVGPEGGFSSAEKNMCTKKFPENIFQFSGNNVLRSETAVVVACGKFSI